MWPEIYHEFPRWAKVSAPIEVAFMKAESCGNRPDLGRCEAPARRRNDLGIQATPEQNKKRNDEEGFVFF
jgi:hypothetical protein